VKERKKRKPQVISRGGGVQPLHPPPRSAPEDSLTRKKQSGTLPWPVTVFLKPNVMMN